MVLLRSWRPRLHETAYFHVVLGRRLWRVDVVADGPQVIKITGGAARLTHRIDGVGVRLWQTSEVEPRRFSLWLSEDPERVPLRMVADASFGEVTMTLAERNVGSARCDTDTESDTGARKPQAPPATLIGRAWRTLDPSDELRTKE
jgi:hypothetical protein